MGRRWSTDDWLKAGGMALVMALLVGFTIYFALTPAEEAVERTSTSYGWLREEQFVVTGTGTAGSATGNANSDGPIRGHVYAIHLDFAAAISDTTDFSITLSSPALTVLDLTNATTDAWYYPVVTRTNSAGSGISAYDRIPISGHLNAGVQESSVMDVVTVTVWWGE